MPRPQRPRRRRCWPSRSLTVLLILLTSIARRAVASSPPSRQTRSLLTFGIGPAFPYGVGAAPGASAAAAPTAAASGGNSNGNNGDGATMTTSKLRTCPGPFEICPAPTLCRNPNRGNEWCYWLYVDKASCVCI